MGSADPISFKSQFRPISIMEIRKLAIGAACALMFLLAGQIIIEKVRKSRSSDAEPRVSKRDPYRKTGSIAGIKSRNNDPAGPRKEFVGATQDLKQLRRLADDPVALASLTGLEWAPTRVALNDARRFDVEEQCRDKIGWPKDIDPTCVFSMTSVVDASGRIAYVRIEETDTHYLTPKCAAMASCVAEDRLKSIIVLPSTYADEIAVRQTVRTKPLNEHFNDPDYVENMMLLLDEDLRGAEQLKGSPDLEFRKLEQANYIAYLQARAARLRHSSGLE